MKADAAQIILPRVVGPSRTVTETAAKTDAQSDMRIGTVVAVTARGIDVAVAAGTVQSAGHLASYAPALGDSVVLIKVNDTWVVLNRIVGPGMATDGSSAASAIGPSFLGGGMVTTTAAGSTAGAAINIPDYDISFWLAANHSALVIAGMPWFGTVAASVIQLMLNYVGVTQISQMRRTTITGSNAVVETLSGVVMPASAGRLVRVVGQVQFISGTGTANVNGFTVAPGYMVALDLGDTSFTPVL